MKNWMGVLFAAFWLVGCQGVAPQTVSLAEMATRPDAPDQAPLLLAEDSKLTTLFVFVPELMRDNFMERTVTGYVPNLRVMLNDETVALVPVLHGVKLVLLPNQQYRFRFGEDETKNQDFYMRRQVLLYTAGPETFKAFDISTSTSTGIDAQVVQLNQAETRERLMTYPLVQPGVAMELITRGAHDLTVSFRPCLTGTDTALCRQQVESLPAGYVPGEVLAHIQALDAEQVRKQQLIELEESLPVAVRRDKYLVSLSSYLKDQNYSAALTIFPKLAALPITMDPSFTFFYGEALLKAGQPAKALSKLYAYIREQGSAATHYAQALEMINQAESQL